jgi:hypothetical protein
VSRSVDRPAVNLVVSNHSSTHGIGEILFTIYHLFSGEFKIHRAAQLRKNSINVIIDEFSRPYFVREVRSIKEEHPGTRVVIIATEFITPVKVLGAELTKTFNFFGSSADWINLCRSSAREAVGKLPLYMQRRYKGFIKCLEVADLLIYLHPEMERGFADLRPRLKSLQAPPMPIYPEIDLHAVNEDDRLGQLPFGFTITGTLTRFRARLARKLVKAFRLAGYEKPVYLHVPFKDAPPAMFDERRLNFNYDVRVDFLFNLNPPQQRTWPHSSPMRIMRAALLGQIPVVTKKFGDHELEQIAMLWDGKVETAVELLRLANSGRDELIAKYMASVAADNETARRKNATVLKALERLGSQLDWINYTFP